MRRKEVWMRDVCFEVIRCDVATTAVNRFLRSSPFSIFRTIPNKKVSFCCTKAAIAKILKNAFSPRIYEGFVNLDAVFAKGPKRVQIASATPTSTTQPEGLATIPTLPRAPHTQVANRFPTRKRAAAVPLSVRFRRLKATIHSTTAASSHDRAAWRADGKRIFRYFRQFSNAKQAALAALKRIHGGQSGASKQLQSPAQFCQDFRLD